MVINGYQVKDDKSCHRSAMLSYPNARQKEFHSSRNFPKSTHIDKTMIARLHFP